MTIALVHPADPGGAPSGRLRRLIGFLVAMLLLVLAVVVVARQGETASAALAAMRSPAPLPLLLLFASLIGSLILTSSVFSILVRPFARVGRIEMLALIASSGLLNLAPFRPGLVGRLAWHRTMNGLSVRNGIRTVIEASLLSAAVAAGFAMMAWLGAGWGEAYGPLLIAAGIPVGLFCAVACMVMWKPRGVRLSLAALLRSLEVLLIAVRYHAVFSLIGSPIPVHASIGLACIATIAGMVPVAGGGLGVREWAVGLVAPLLVPLPDAAGLAADLVHRAAELSIIVVTGSCASIWLARTLRGSAVDARSA